MVCIYPTSRFLQLDFLFGTLYNIVYTIVKGRESMSKPKWTPGQQNCIDARGGTVLVSAAAGSGKTAVLIERIVSILQDPDNPIDIDKLLIVTFTKAAAAEMRSRLHKRLAEEISANPHNRHLLRQQMLLPSALICTTDSFCVQMLREYATQAGISPRFRIGDETALALLKHEAARDVIAEAHKQNDPAFISLCNTLTADRSDDMLTEQLLKTYNFIQAHPFPLKWLDEQQERFAHTGDLADTVWGRILLRQAYDNLTAASAVLTKALEEMDGDDAIYNAYAGTFSTALDGTLNALRYFDGTWDEAVDAVHRISFPGFKSLNNYEDTAFKDRITAMRNHAKELVSSAVNDCLGYSQARAEEELADAYPLVKAMFDLVRHFTARFSELKAEQQYLDFNDAEHRLLALLATPNEDGSFSRTEIAKEIGARFLHIMVDEYQDTNATQDTLFAALSDNEENLFFVGDLKQSIYGFRQAMPSIFQGRRERATPYNGTDFPASITLGNNFRSRSQVADITNFVFRKLMTREIGGIVYGESEELVASATFENAGDPAYDAEFIISERNNHPKGLSRHAAEARLVGERILEMMASGFKVSDKSGPRQLEYRDCCILLRSIGDRATDYMKTFQEMGIPATTDTREDLLQRTEIRLILAMLRTIDNPLLDVPMLATLMSPVYAFSPDEIAQIRLAAKDAPLFNAVRACARQKGAVAQHCARFLDSLSHFRTLSAALPADQLIRRFYEETDLLPIMSARIGGTARIANLRRFYDLARHFEDHDFRGLSAFIRYMTRLEEKGVEIDAASASSAQNAVRLMTVHHSKGLEFPVVFLTDLGGTFSRQSLQNDILLHAENGISIIHRDYDDMYETLPFHRKALSFSIIRSEIAEELRLLYVAMTRAKDKLIMIETVDNLASKMDKLSITTTSPDNAFTTSFLQGAAGKGEWLLACLADHEAGCNLTNPHGEIDHQAGGLSVMLRNPAAEPKAKDDILQEATAVVPEDIEERFAYEYPFATLGQVAAKVTASQTAHQQSKSDLPPMLARPAFLSKGGLTPAQRGTATHIFLEHLVLSDTDAAAQAESLVERDILTEQQRDALDLPRMQRFLQSDLASRMAASSLLLREFPFTIERPLSEIAPAVAATLPEDASEEFIVVQGIADALFEEDGELVIVDYKTDRVDSGEVLAERYRPQLMIYKDALSRALQRPVKDCVIYSFHLNETVVV